MEPLNYFSMTIIMIPVLLMAAQNMSMLSGKWRSYYGWLFFVKILLTTINVNFPGKIPLSGFDAGNFSRQAMRIFSEYPNSFFGIFQSESASFFGKEVAVVYYVFGANRTYVYYLICLCSLIAFKYMVLMAKEMTENDELAQKCGILFLAWPILLLHASSFLRENQCNLLFILSFYCFVCFIKRRNPVNFVGAIFWAVLAAMTHSGMIALVICYCIFGSMVSKSGEIKFSPVKIVFGFLLIFGLMSSSFSDSMTEKFKGAEDAQSVEEIADIVSTEKAEEADTMYIGSRPSNPIKLLLLEPYLLLMFIFSPLPYQVHSVGQGISFLVESIPQFMLIRATYMYLVVERANGTPQVKGYKTIGLWTLLLFYFIFSLGTTCYGSAIRHRSKITPMLLVFTTMYYAEKKKIADGTEEESTEDSSVYSVRGKPKFSNLWFRRLSLFARRKPGVNEARFGRSNPLVNGKPGAKDARLRRLNPFVQGMPGANNVRGRTFNPFIQDKPGVNARRLGRIVAIIRSKSTSRRHGGSVESPIRRRKK